MVVAALPYLAMFLPSHAQQSDLGRQSAPGFTVAPSPAFLKAQPQPVVAPPPAQPALYYRPDPPHHFPPGISGIPSWSIFNPRY
jgi:hypothetical protein